MKPVNVLVSDRVQGQVDTDHWKAVPKRVAWQVAPTFLLIRDQMFLMRNQVVRETHQRYAR